MSHKIDIATKPPVVLTIAGFDPSNGAGVTADLQVFAAHGLFGTAAITALTVQSTLGVAAVTPVRGADLGASLNHLVEDLRPAGIKIGMLGSAEIVHVVADFLQSLSDVGGAIPIVLDPVLKSSSGAGLLSGDALQVLRDELLPRVSWMTPNHSELSALGELPLADIEEELKAYRRNYPGLNVVVTGGDIEGEPLDLWVGPHGASRWFQGRRVETTSTHGTGCAFSSALLSGLVLGEEPAEAIAKAKTYVEGALRRAPGVGRGHGPLGLLWPLQGC